MGENRPSDVQLGSWVSLVYVCMCVCVPVCVHSAHTFAVRPR